MYGKETTLATFYYLDLFLCNIDFDHKVLMSGQFGHLRVDCLVHTCTLGLYCNVVQLQRCSISHYVAHALVTVFILLFLGHVYL